MPLDFLKRRGDKPQAETTVPQLLPEEVEAEEHEVKLTYRAKSSQGVRMAAGPNALAELPNMLAGVARTPVETIEPLSLDFSEAAPVMQRPSEALQWINANHDRSPIARHALVVLESVDAVDPAFETIARWDEATGDMIVRGVVGWGGRGVRGDTDRTAQKILASLLANVLASQHAVGPTPVERPVPGARHGGLVCAHCGFASAHERAFYCPKCGMRMLRG
ncbi:MAG: hypothetical protein H0V04_09310 [Chloroflexi bacterium]|nr:hypothetical protein [Chloroflexota bacterium]